MSDDKEDVKEAPEDAEDTSSDEESGNNDSEDEEDEASPETPPTPTPTPAPVQAASQAIPPKPVYSDDHQAPSGNTVTVTGSRPQLPQPISSDDLKQQSQFFSQDLYNGHITPKTYGDLFNDKSTLGKVGTLFGLMASGMGSGLTGQPNALLQMMDKTISNDLEAQKNSKANAHNLYQLNLTHQTNLAQIDHWKKEGVLTDAQAAVAKKDLDIKSFALSKMQSNSMALHDMAMKIQRLPPGNPERTNLEKQLAIMNQAVQNENFNISDRAAAASALNNSAFNGGGTGAGAGSEKEFQNEQGVLRIGGNAPIAEDRAARHFPGIPGQSSIPLTPADREQINSGITFQNQLDRFMDWTKAHSGDLDPKDRREGEALAAQLQGSYRMATHGGVYKEGEQGFISSIIDSEPTKFFNAVRVMPQLQAVKKESSAQLNQLVQSKGFDGLGNSSTKAEPEEQYKLVGGVKYKRGPNGEAVKVSDQKASK